MDDLLCLCVGQTSMGAGDVVDLDFLVRFVIGEYLLLRTQAENFGVIMTCILSLVHA